VRLSSHQTESFLLAGLSYAQSTAWAATRFPFSVQCLSATVSEFPLLPCPALAFDVAGLLLGDRLLHPTSPDIGGLREALLQYEDFLARLCTERRFLRLSEAVQGAPQNFRAAAVGVFLAQLCSRLEVPAGPQVPLGFLRSLGGRPSDEVAQQARQEVLHLEVAQALSEVLFTIAKAARAHRELIAESDLFLLENISSLQKMSARVSLAQLTETSRALEEALPLKLKASLRDTGDALTKLEDESSFPVGGFSSISTVGNIENLVVSELIYMDEKSEERPDMFDVRFVEGELLYYARDEAVSLRRKKALLFVFETSLLQSRMLDPGEHYQRVTWALGLCAAIIRKLFDALTAEALVVECVFPFAEELPLEEERTVLELLLREYKERGLVTFVDAIFNDDFLASAKRRLSHRIQVVQLNHLGVFSGGTCLVEFSPPVWTHAVQRCLDSLLEHKHR
jgi:vWA domain found in the FtsH ternary systems/N-terminal helical region fused to the FtsH ternary system vWA domain